MLVTKPFIKHMATLMLLSKLQESQLKSYLLQSIKDNQMEGNTDKSHLILSTGIQTKPKLEIY